MYAFCYFGRRIGLLLVIPFCICLWYLIVDDDNILHTVHHIEVIEIRDHTDHKTVLFKDRETGDRFSTDFTSSDDLDQFIKGRVYDEYHLLATFVVVAFAICLVICIGVFFVYLTYDETNDYCYNNIKKINHYRRIFWKRVMIFCGYPEENYPIPPILDENGWEFTLSNEKK